MNGGFTVPEAARLLKIPERRVRAFLRAGLIADADQAGQPRLEFRDLVVLRLARTLADEGISARRVARVLELVRKQMDDGKPLSAITVRKETGRLVVDDGTRAWEPESGQQHFRLALPAATDTAQIAAPTVAGENSAPDPHCDDINAPHAPKGDDAEQWFQVARRLEDTDPEGAYQAYLRALAWDPEHLDATINIGRMCAAAGQLERAAAYFRQAVRLAPDNAIAHFNLGVTLHDLGDLAGARTAYQAALEIDPEFADAHFNLASLLDQDGDHTSAREHLLAYQKTTEEGLT